MQQDPFTEIRTMPQGGTGTDRHGICTAARTESVCPGDGEMPDGKKAQRKGAAGGRRGHKEKRTCTYRMRTDTVCDEDGKAYTVYGIEAVDVAGEVLLGFCDVFFDRRKAEQFVALCNEGHLSLCHLPDVVEDALT